MKSIRLALLSFLLVSYLTGCVATGPIYTEALSEPGDAVIYVYRTRTLTNAALTPVIEVNGRKAGKIATGGYLVVKVSPGPQYVELSVAGFEGRSAIGLNMRPGDRAYARIDTLMAGSFYIERSFSLTGQLASTAELEISSMRHVGTSDLRTAEAGH